MPRTIERVIGKVVGNQFPMLNDAFIFRTPNLITESPANAAMAEPVDVRVVEDQSGKAYFMFGISTWGSDDIVAE